jgi:hypothetical protein
VNADEFNARYPVGTPVFAYPFIRPEDPVAIAYQERVKDGRTFGNPDPCKRLKTKTRTPAWTLGHGEPVVSVEGYAGGICLSHVDVREQCDVEFVGGGRCTKDAGHRTPENQDPHTPPTTVEEALPTVGALPVPGGSPQITEFAVRLPSGNVVRTGDPTSRRDQEARLARYIGEFPAARLVQRTVHYGDWTEADR